MPHLPAERSGHSAGAAAEARAILWSATTAQKAIAKRICGEEPVSSAARAKNHDPRPFELAAITLEPDIPSAGTLQMRLTLMLIVVVQVAWLMALGYLVLAFA